MTLLELLIKELPQRGGWPEGAFECFIHKNEQYRGTFYSVGGGGVYGASSIDTNSVEYVQNCSYIPGYNVIREEYEVAIAAQQPLWNGEGLPPIGCDVEYETIKGNWRKCRVMYLGEKCNIVRTDEWGEVSCGLSVKFRPLRTEAGRKRDAAIESLLSLHVFTRPVAEKTIEAIAAGKIPGVEITK